MHFTQWFEIPVTNMERAISFYGDVFGVKLEPNQINNLVMAWFPMKPGEAGAPGALVQAENYTPSHEGTLIYATVTNIEEMLKKVTAHGGKVLMQKTDIGEHGFFAHIEDTEGNRLGIHSMK